MSGLLSPLHPTIREGEAAWLAFDSRVMRQASQREGREHGECAVTCPAEAVYTLRPQTPVSRISASHLRWKVNVRKKMQKDLGWRAKVLGKRHGERIFTQRRYSRERCGAVFQKQAILEG